MICDLCTAEEATVHLSETINDDTRELHLCEACAQEKGLETLQDFGLPDMLGDLAGFTLDQQEVPQPTLSCSACSMRYEDFRKSGRLGCGECYEAFHPYLAPLLKRIHGSAHHVGKQPAPAKPKRLTQSEQLQKLKAKLTEAIQKEEFEEAIALRDRLKVLESKGKRRSS